MNIPSILYQLAKVFKQHQKQCFLVGGATRDILRGLKAKDFDIATDAHPPQVISMFRRVIPTGIKHGTVTVLFKDQAIEVTTFRIEGKYSDGRHPDNISFNSSIYEDLKRRDFTINAIAYDLINKKIYDPFHGIDDLKKKSIRAIGNPIHRFQEDGLRTLRACRFVAQLDFSIQSQTLADIKKCATLIINVSAERIKDELIKILYSLLPSSAFIIMQKTGLLKTILPELNDCVDVAQPEMHRHDVFYHSLYSCDAAPYDNLVLRLAALLHDIGKPPTMTKDDNNKISFYRHEQVSAKMAKKILKRLKFPNKVIQAVVHLINNHMFNYDDNWTDVAVRRFIKRIGYENVNDLFMLRRADQFGLGSGKISSKSLSDFSLRIQKIMEDANALSIKDLAVDGKDIMQKLKIKPGKNIGVILNYLLECVIEDPCQNERKRLLDIAFKFYRDRLNLNG